jgi:hypothetical protein
MAEGSLFCFWHTKITDFLLLSCSLPYPEFNTNLFIDLHCVHIRKKNYRTIVNSFIRSVSRQEKRNPAFFEK